MTIATTTMTGKEAIAAAEATLRAVEHLNWTVEVCASAAQHTALVARMMGQAHSIPKEEYAKFGRNIKLAADIVDGDAQVSTMRALALWNDAIDYVVECVGAFPKAIVDWQGRERDTMEFYLLEIGERAARVAGDSRQLWMRPPVKDWRAPTKDEEDGYTRMIVQLSESEIFIEHNLKMLEALQESVQ